MNVSYLLCQTPVIQSSVESKLQLKNIIEKKEFLPIYKEKTNNPFKQWTKDRFFTKEDNQWPISIWILLTFEKYRVKSTMTYQHTPTKMTKMQNTDSIRYACGCLVDTLRHCLELLSMKWLLPPLPRVLTASISSPSEISWAASYSRSQWQMAQRGTILRGHSHVPPQSQVVGLHCNSTSSVHAYFLLLPSTRVDPKGTPS